MSIELREKTYSIRLQQFCLLNWSLSLLDWPLQLLSWSDPMAAPEPYLPLIAQICKALSQRERRAVVYLCDSADTDDSPARLREILESKVKSCERGDLFLAELLLHIKRIDVLKSIFGCETVETVTNRQTLSKFRWAFREIFLLVLIWFYTCGLFKRIVHASISRYR